MTDAFNHQGPRERSADRDPAAGTAPARSVLAELGEATWSDEDGLSYEVALASINEVIGAYSGLIGREEASPHPDTTKLAAWRQAKLAWAQKLRVLTPADPPAVQAARHEAAEALRSLSHHG
jgi:hypothetical protein